jgi:hypothetical protein
LADVGGISIAIHILIWKEEQGGELLALGREINVSFYESGKREKYTDPQGILFFLHFSRAMAIDIELYGRFCHVLAEHLATRQLPKSCRKLYHIMEPII